MARSKLSCYWNHSAFDEGYRAGVSLHSHTNHSKERLDFIPEFAEKCPLLSWALDAWCRKSRIPVDFSKAYWTPPLTAQKAFDVEKKQIENAFGLAALVSLTDHDTLGAPSLLSVLPETKHVPFAFEWSVPFAGAMFHLGVQNLPGCRAHAIQAELAAFSRDPRDARLTEILAMLDAFPQVLLVFNHPLWNLGGLGPARFEPVLDQFLQSNAAFLHALELNATRNWKENVAVKTLADRWQLPVISGGDRHGCEPSAALNLTRAQCFSGFVHEIRKERHTHVVLMPQYNEPRCTRITQELLDVIRHYPDHPPDSRRWDNRVFHPNDAATRDQALSTLWKAPPAFLELIFSAIRLSENASVRRALGHAMTRDAELHSFAEMSQEAIP